jgi:uncharacterized protein (TIGR03083 family)
MAGLDHDPSGLVPILRRRTRAIVDTLTGLDGAGWFGPSALPGWDRLTVACHLRFGAVACRRLTEAAVGGRPAVYYPEGRERQRPASLRPEPGESAADVVASLTSASELLHETWEGLTVDQWELAVVEPPGQADLGELGMDQLAMLRVTEVEVHGVDLDLGLDDWDPQFVDAALRFRLDRLNARRTNHRPFDAEVCGSWLLRATEGPAHLVAVDGFTVRSRPADADEPATAVIEASSRDLLALLLGRPFRLAPRYGGDPEFARSFTRALPGP